jgi:hypothetical protein
VRTEYVDPYTVREPDGTSITYDPGREEYFDHVLLSLARTFLVAEVGEVESLDGSDVLELYYEKVSIPRRATSNPYVPTPALAMTVAASYKAPRQPPQHPHERVQDGLVTAAKNDLALVA